MSATPERDISADVAGALHDSTGSYELVIALLAAAGFGFLIDRAFGIVPVMTIVFAVAGFIGAGYSLYLRYQLDMQAATDVRTARVQGTEGSVT